MYTTNQSPYSKSLKTRSADPGSDPPCPYNGIHYDLKGKTDPRSALLLWGRGHWIREGDVGFCLTACLCVSGAPEEDEFDMFAQTRGSSLADQRKRWDTFTVVL